MITRAHHVGFMVDNLEREIETYETLGFNVFKRFGEAGVKAAMLFNRSDAGVELFEFEDTSSGLAQMSKRHSAFVSDDLENDILEFIKKGYEIAIPITDGEATKRWTYLKDPAGNYIELLEPLD